MKPLTRAKGIAAVALLLVIGFYAIVNDVSQMPENLQTLGDMTPPSGLADVRYSVEWIENVLNDNVAYKTEFVEVHSYLQLLMGKEETTNFDIIRSRNGETDYGNFYPVVSADIPELAQRMKRMRDYVATRGTTVLFWNTLSLYTRGYSDYAPGLPAYDQNPDADAMLYYLQSYGVDYLDSRAALAGSELPPEAYRFKTDHHWTVQAAFESFRALVRKLDDDYGAGLDPDGFYADPANYSSILYPQSFLGTLGRRAGIPFSGLDDFTLIWPRFETSFTVEAVSGDSLRWVTGSFEESLLDMYYMKTNPIYTTAPYTAYLGGNSAYKRIVNHNNPDGPRMLIIYDSFALPAVTFLASVMGEIHMLWPLATDSVQSPLDITAYIAEHDFDYIIVELYPGNFNRESFSFFTE